MSGSASLDGGGGLSEFQFAFITPLIIDIKSSNVLWNISAFPRF